MNNYGPGSLHSGMLCCQNVQDMKVYSDWFKHHFRLDIQLEKEALYLDSKFPIVNTTTC